jgi:hypothetical protein
LSIIGANSPQHGHASRLATRRKDAFRGSGVFPHPAWSQESQDCPNPTDVTTGSGAR